MSAADRSSLQAHPFLIVSYPILQVMSVNLHECALTVMILPLLAANLFAAFLLWVMSKLMDKGEKAAIATSLSLFLLFLYGLFADATVGLFVPYHYHLVTIPIWLLLIGLLCKLLAGYEAENKKLATFTSFFNSLGCFLVAIVSVLLLNEVYKVSQVQSPTFASKTHLQNLPEKPSSALPDVYYIILDGYSRNDVLRKQMGFDNSKFTKELERQGFYVARSSHSNYHSTVFSLNASLNLDYISSPTPSYLALLKSLEDSAVFRVFKHYGYKTEFHSSGGFEDVFHRYDNIYRTDIWMTNFSFITFHRSPLRPLVEHLKLRTKQKQTRGVLNNVLASPDRHSPDIPRFVLAHILAPHTPYVLKADGSTVDSYHITKTHTEKEAYEAYTSYMQYVNDWALKFVKKVKSIGKVAPVIILQADHGTVLAYSIPGLSKEKRHWVRLAILNAYHVPEGMRKKLHHDISPVNTFRLLLNELFGFSMPKLEDKGHYVQPNNEFDYYPVEKKDLKLNL